MIVLVCYFWQPIALESVYCAEILKSDQVIQAYYYNGRYTQMLSWTMSKIWVEPWLGTKHD